MHTALLWPRNMVKIALLDTEKLVARRNLTRSMKPGDIVMMSMDPAKNDAKKGLAANLVRAYRKVAPTLQGDMGHSALYVGNGKVVESRLREGVTLKTVAEATKDKDILVIRPDASEGDKKSAVEFAKEQVGKKYDNRALAFTSLGVMLPESVTRVMNKMFLDTPRLEGTIDKWTCSNLVAAAYPKLALDSVGVSMAAPVAFRNSEDVRPLFRTKPRKALMQPTWGRAKDE